MNSSVKSRFAHLYVLRFLSLFLFLACQSAMTQSTGKPTESPPESEQKNPIEDLPHVNDQKEVTLLPEAKKSPGKNLLANMVTKYASADAIKMDLTKTTKLKILNRVDEYKGQLFMMGKSKLRLEFSEPQKSVAVLNGTRAWVIEYPPKDVDDKVRVSKFVMKATPGQSQLLVTSILSSGNLLKIFKLSKKTIDHSQVRYDLRPRKKSEEIKSLSVLIDESKQEISEIRYADSIENETTFKFSKTTFGAKVDKDLFEYSVPKTAEVNEF